jgi:hypothetical protein
MPDSLAADATDQIHNAANRSDTDEALVWRMDEALVIALDSDDWSDCRRIAAQLIGSLQDYEGCYFGLASAAYFIDGDAPGTCKLIQLCLSKPRSKWRPDVYRLLGIALQGAGQYGAAADAFQSARSAVTDLDMAEEDKERYRQWIEDAIAPPMSDQVAADANRGRPDAMSEIGTRLATVGIGPQRNDTMAMKLRSITVVGTILSVASGSTIAAAQQLGSVGMANAPSNPSGFMSPSIPNNPIGFTNMYSPNNPMGFTNPMSPNNPTGFTNMYSPNNPTGLVNPGSPNYPFR